VISFLTVALMLAGVAVLAVQPIAGAALIGASLLIGGRAEAENELVFMRLVAWLVVAAAVIALWP
jgi:hypothetical protein